jgi:hypothetical protein
VEGVRGNREVPPPHQAVFSRVCGLEAFFATI